MSYFVLAFGLAMSALGVVAIAFGYPIIQVERGWAMVIAGATLFAGGAITAALGLVLRSLTAVSRAIRGNQISVPAIPSVITGDHTPLNAQGAIPGIAAPITAPVEEPRLPASDEIVRAEAAQHFEDKAHVVEELQTSAGHKPVESIADSPVEEPSVAPFSMSEPPPQPSAALPDDWLDQSFAEFDRDNGDLSHHAPTEPELPHAPEPEPHQATAVPASEPESTPTESSSVIGRYESEGTSYVMFADGSIEAQSPAGVYRFASMSELKSFIES